MNSNNFLKLSQILDSQNEEALVYDLDTNQILLANKKACQSLGFAINEIINSYIDIIIPKKFNPITLKKGKSNFVREIHQFVTKCGYSFMAGTKNKKISIKDKKYQLITFKNLSNLAGISQSDKSADPEYIKFSKQLFTINQKITNVNEDMFYKNMVYSLAGAFEVRWVMICLLSSSGKEAKILSLWDQNKFSSELVYQLKGTPCGKIKDTKELFYCEKSLTKNFPEDLLAHKWGVESYLGLPIKNLGFLAVMDDKPIKAEKYLEYLPTMQYFSDRIAKEIVLNNFKITTQKKETSNKLTGLIPPNVPLTKRELQVLEHVCSGLSSSSIANQLAVALPTVKFHLKNIYNKLGIKGRNGLLKVVSNLT
jgi:DNA-binding CsgD family transcriptional regulator